MVERLKELSYLSPLQVNDANRHHFEKWAKSHPQVRLVSDGTSCNEDRLGAVACIELAIRHFNIQDHTIIIGG